MTEGGRAYLARYRALVRFKIAIKQASRLQLQNILAMSEEAEINLATEFFARGMTSRLLAVMAGESLKVPAITYPRDWWEAVKERFLPRWAKRWWPITYRYVVWDATVLYPMIRLPDENHYLSEVRTEIRERTENVRRNPMKMNTVASVELIVTDIEYAVEVPVTHKQARDTIKTGTMYQAATIRAIVDWPKSCDIQTLNLYLRELVEERRVRLVDVAE